MHETAPEITPVNSTAVKTVVNTCLRSAFLDRELDKNSKGTRIQLFTDGQPPFSPTGSAREEFLQEAGNVAEFYIRDMIDPEGNLLPEKNDEFRNVLEVGSELVKIFTNEYSHISLTQQAQSLNILGAALYLARNPDATVEISAGIGGSDSDMTSARFPAYGIPGARITERMISYYAKRKQEKTVVETTDKIINAEFSEFVSDPEIKAQKRTRKKEIVDAIARGEIDINDHLSSEDIDAIYGKYAIPRNRPTFRVFFAHEAARAINHTMDPKKIPQRTEENMKAMQEYMAQHHPAAAAVLELSVDKPWSEHTRYQQALVKYLAHELRTSDDPTVQKTLNVLQKLGQNHGGDMGAELAAEYAAIHPIVFGDRMDLPSSPFVVGQKRDPDVRIVIGGKTEREFCAVREYLTKTANVDRMIAFLEAKREEGTEDSGAEIIPALLRWKKIAQSKRNSYGTNSNPKFMRPDLPVHTIQLITQIGATPTYYPTPFDIPSSASTEEILSHADNLWSLNSQLKNGDQTVDRAVLKHVANDYMALRDDILSSQALRVGQEVKL